MNESNNKRERAGPTFSLAKRLYRDTRILVSHLVVNRPCKNTSKCDLNHYLRRPISTFNIR